MRGVFLALFLIAVPASGQIVILGDSLAHGAGDETGRGLAGTLGAVNLGVNGARTADLIRHLGRDDVRLAVQRARLIVVSIGGNDLFGSSFERIRTLLAPRLTTELVVARVARVIGKIRHENPSANIVLLGLYNPYRESNIGPWLDEQISRWDGRIITRFAANRAVNVIRIADLIDERRAISPIDHYHPSAAGYRAIAERIRAAYTFSSP